MPAEGVPSPIVRRVHPRSSLLECAQPSTVSVLAVRYCELSVLMRRDFLAIVRTNPDLMRHLQKYAAQQAPAGPRPCSEATSSSSRHDSGHTAPDFAQVGGGPSTDAGGGGGHDGVRPWRLLLPWLAGGRSAAVAPLSESHPAMERHSSQQSEATERASHRPNSHRSSDRSPNGAPGLRSCGAAVPLRRGRRSSAAGIVPSSLTRRHLLAPQPAGLASLYAGGGARGGSFGTAEDDDGTAAVQEAALGRLAGLSRRHTQPRGITPGIAQRALWPLLPAGAFAIDAMPPLFQTRGEISSSNAPGRSLNAPGSEAAAAAAAAAAVVELPIGP